MTLFPSDKDKVRDPLFETKLIAGLLVTALIVVTGPVLIYKVTHFQASDPRPVSTITPPPAAENPGSDIMARLQDADPVAGEAATVICAACHTFDKGGANMIGPNLWSIVDREIASVEGAYYTSALEDLEGIWTVERLDVFLEDPLDYVPGTSMAINVRQPEKRADIIAYLQTLTD